MSAPILLALRIGMALALFLFVGWAYFTLWKDLQVQARLLALPRIPTLQLVPKEKASSRTHRFNSPQVLVGRDPACELYLEDKTISAHHARLYYQDSQWWLEDQQSTNGTFLNQEQVFEPMVLTSGDRLRCGQVEFQVMIAERAQSASRKRI